MTSEVHYSVTSDELTIAGKSFIMESVELNLTDLVLFGERLQSDPVSLTQPLNAFTQFINNVNNHHFKIPIGTYTVVKFSTELASLGAPSCTITGKYFSPNGTTYNVDIALKINHDYSIQLQDTDGSSTVLIEGDNKKNLSVALDTQMLFEDINPGLWNAAVVTSNNGAQTIVVDDMNNANIKSALEAKMGTSLVVRFQ